MVLYGLLGWRGQFWVVGRSYDPRRHGEVIVFLIFPNGKSKCCIHSAARRMTAAPPVGGTPGLLFIIYVFTMNEV